MIKMKDFGNFGQLLYFGAFGAVKMSKRDSFSLKKDTLSSTISSIHKELDDEHKDVSDEVAERMDDESASKETNSQQLKLLNKKKLILMKQLPKTD